VTSGWSSDADESASSNLEIGGNSDAKDEAGMECERRQSHGRLTFMTERLHGLGGPKVSSHWLDVILGLGAVRLRHEGCIGAVT
jgi:hypothetical protein